MSIDAGLLEHVRGRLASGEIDDAAVRSALVTSGRVIGSAGLGDLVRAARAELAGAGPLQRLLELAGCTDVLVNGPGQVWVDRGAGLERRVVDALSSPAEVRALAVRLAALAGQRLDDAAPVCDGRLPDGTRLHAVLEPIAATHTGAAISLRVLRTTKMRLADLGRRNALPPLWVELLIELVRRRANLLITGGTGTGKTTLLAALLAEVGPDERVVTVEEARELAPQHPHIVPVVARRPNVEGVGAVTLADLVRVALRMRPDRLVVGECRGEEVREMLLALNTGHSGMCTVHCNSVTGVSARLIALGALAGMSQAAVAAGALAALDVVVHLRRVGGHRYVSGIGLVQSAAAGFEVREVATWNPISTGSLNTGSFNTEWHESGPQVTDATAWAELTRRWFK